MLIDVSPSDPREGTSINLTLQPGSRSSCELSPQEPTVAKAESGKHPSVCKLF